MDAKTRQLARGALLLALALAVQSLRLFLPLPYSVSTFVIGTGVHFLLVLAVSVCGLRTAALMSVLLPCTAYFEGQLALPFLLPVVISGNLLFSLLTQALAGRALTFVLPPLAKAVLMGGLVWLLLPCFLVAEENLRRAIFYAMTVPQFVTGMAGLWLFERLGQRLLRS